MKAKHKIWSHDLSTHQYYVALTIKLYIKQPIVCKLAIQSKTCVNNAVFILFPTKILNEVRALITKTELSFNFSKSKEHKPRQIKDLKI